MGVAPVNHAKALEWQLLPTLSTNGRGDLALGRRGLGSGSAGDPVSGWPAKLKS